MQCLMRSDILKTGWATSRLIRCTTQSVQGAGQFFILRICHDSLTPLYMPCTFWDAAYIACVQEHLMLGIYSRQCKAKSTLVSEEQFTFLFHCTKSHFSSWISLLSWPLSLSRLHKNWKQTLTGRDSFHCSAIVISHCLFSLCLYWFLVWFIVS